MFAVLVTIGSINPVIADADQAMGSTGTEINCTALSSDMQEFAAQLSDSNRKVFCNSFNDVQRSTAIQLSSQPDSAGNMMSADQAVMKVARDNNITIPSASQGSGCPVK